MRPDDRVRPDEHETATMTAGAARARVLLALIAWVVVAAISIGSLLYTTLAR